MADEITVLEGDGGINVQVFFRYAIGTPAQVGGANVVPTPTTQDGETLLPPIANTLLSAADKTAIDAGTVAWEVVTARVLDGQTNAQLVTQAQALYTLKKIQFDAFYAKRYEHAGKQLDAP